MDPPQEIAKQVELMPPSMQEQVLRYVSSLRTEIPKEISGADLRKFAGTLDPKSAQEMMDAVESECERIDLSEW